MKARRPEGVGKLIRPGGVDCDENTSSTHVTHTTTGGKSSVVEDLAGTHEVLGSISGSGRNKTKQNKKTQLTKENVISVKLTISIKQN